MLQVFPFAHVSNDKKCVTLINPQAVDLDAYKKKLLEAIKTYERQVCSAEMFHELNSSWVSNRYHLGYLTVCPGTSM